MSDPQDKFHEPEIKEGYGVFWSPVRWKAYKPGTRRPKPSPHHPYQVIDQLREEPELDHGDDLAALVDRQAVAAGVPGCGGRDFFTH